VRQRVRAVSANATERDTLGHRTDEALTILATSSQLDKIIPAIVTLGASYHHREICQVAWTVSPPVIVSATEFLSVACVQIRQHAGRRFAANAL
jgi:hypothetical protein